MLSDFKKFAFKGNLIDMAVGIMIGGAFATVVKSLVDHVFMPPLGMLMANVDFTKLKIVLADARAAGTLEDGTAVAAREEVAIGYGQFLTDFIAFILMAFAVYIVVKKVIAAMQKEEEIESVTPPKEEVLLTEIRDLLAKGQGPTH